MSTVTENDLRELKDLISDRFNQVNDRMNERFDQVKEKLNEIKINVATLKEGQNEIKIDVATLKEGQNGINKRLDNLDFIARTIIASVAVALLAGLAKLLYPNLI